MNKKKYEIPEMKIVLLNTDDIIRTSGDENELPIVRNNSNDFDFFNDNTRLG